MPCYEIRYVTVDLSQCQDLEALQVAAKMARVTLIGRKIQISSLQNAEKKAQEVKMHYANIVVRKAARSKGYKVTLRQDGRLEVRR